MSVMDRTVEVLNLIAEVHSEQMAREATVQQLIDSYQKLYEDLCRERRYWLERAVAETQHTHEMMKAWDDREPQ